jgi:hypothetical protein
VGEVTATDPPHPIESQILLVAGAKASVTLTQLSELLARAQDYVRPRAETFERQFERIDGPDGLAFYLSTDSYWNEVGDALELTDREVDAVRRAHAEQFRRAGRRLGRIDEFESTLEIRDVVTTGDPPARPSR